MLTHSDKHSSLAYQYGNDVTFSFIGFDKFEKYDGELNSETNI